ncbi:Copia protein, partial [Mucuna pruriens]
MRCHNCQKLGYYAREGAKNKPNNRAHLAQDEGTMPDFEVLRDQELFQDLTVKSKGELIHSALIAEVEPVEFDKAVTEDKLLKKVGIGEVYALVARIETIKLVVAIATNASWSMHQLDVKSTFLNGPLEVYVDQLQGKENKVYKLKKALYGLTQASRAWNRRIDGYLSQIGLKKCTSEQMFMMNEFEMSDLGLLSYFLRIEFEITKYGTIMHQSKYARDLLRRLNMQQSNPAGTPLEETDEELVDPTHYRKIVGCLRFMQEPRQSYLLATKRILRYVQVTVGFGVLFPKGEVEAKPKLIGHSDSNWCGDKSDRKNTVWYIFFYGGAPISWSSTKELVEKNSKKVKLLVDNKSAIDLARHPTSYGRSKHIETRFYFLREQVSSEKSKKEHYRTEIRIVRSYLLHYGYEDTLNSFDVASKSTLPPIYIAQEGGIDEQEITYALNHRKTLRQLIRNGDIDVAFGKLREWYPQLVEVGALEEAVKYGRIELLCFFGLPVFEDLVQDCVALLAYERPLESSVGYLLKDSQREVVADTVNAMILSTNPNMKVTKHCLHSYLERLLRQLTACCLERRSLNGEQGEAFQLQRAVNHVWNRFPVVELLLARIFKFHFHLLCVAACSLLSKGPIIKSSTLFIAKNVGVLCERPGPANEYYCLLFVS